MTRQRYAIAAGVALGVLAIGVAGLAIRASQADHATRIAVARSAGDAVPKLAVAAPASRAPEVAGPPFYFLVATSGTRFGGADGVDVEYARYQTPAFKTGITVPILYMRTTRGKSADWTFDPDFDPNAKSIAQCGERRLADDSLNDVIAHAIAKRLPTMFVLNGGIWADSGCNVPDIDLNDHLEQRAANCQWSQSNAVFADDHLKNLSGSVDSPELARSLTYNVYATEVRRYKRRNLMDAAAAIAAFAKAHPDLFVGVTLDADTYMNPFFDGAQWFDYNPGTVRQFREWLQGSGPYAGRTSVGRKHASRRPASDQSEAVPDLRAYRRSQPLSLAQVNALAKRNWLSWEEVDPPRHFPGSPRDALRAGDIAYWDDPWFAQWDVFRRHLVALHYAELAKWTNEAGIDADRIYTAQGFAAPYGRNRPFALRVTSTGQNYDSAGMSLEGAKPPQGHLGAILYGRAAENDVPTENGRSLFWNFAHADAAWGIVELSISALNRPEHVPSYDKAYRAFRDAFNFDARLITVMTWNGPRGSQAGQPGYRAYTSWRETVAEDAMRDFAVAHANVPPGARLWTFGSSRLVSDDGWSVDGGRIVSQPGRLVVESPDLRVALVSPADQWIRPRAHRRLSLEHDGTSGLASVAVSARWPDREDWVQVGKQDAIAAGPRVEIALDWPSAADPASQLRIDVTRASAGSTFAIRRIALLR